MIPRKTVCLSLLIILPTVVVRAQQSDSCLRRTVVANVVDEHGDQQEGLQAAQFRARIGSRPVKVLSAQFHRGSRILIVLDTSGSMRVPADKWQLVRTSLEGFVSSIPAEDSVALMTFSSRVEAKVEFSQGRDAVAMRLKALRTPKDQVSNKGSVTALDDALMAAIALFSPTRPGDIIYAVTDGDDNASHEGMGNVLRALQASGLRLFGFIVVDEFVVPDQVTGVLDFKELSERSGGTVVLFGPQSLPVPSRSSLFPSGFFSLTAETRNKLDKDLQRLYEQMSSYYLLQLEFRDAPGKPSRWKLEVVDAEGKKQKQMDIRTADRIQPCHSEQP